MKNPTWTVNYYHAAVCITAGEISRKMQEVYDTTDDLPKSWDVQDPRLHTKGDKKGEPDPRWEINATKIGPPSVSFATDIKNGVNLITQVQEGDFKHLVLDTEEMKLSWEQVSLKNIVFFLQTNVAGIEHKAGEGETVDRDFTVQSLYADLDNPKLISNVDSGYELTDDSIDALTNVLALQVPSDIVTLVSGSSVKGNPYASADEFWNALKTSLGNKADKISAYKGEIVDAAHLAFAAPDDTKRSVSQVLLDMCKSDNYKKSYVFGKSKIPNVDQTKGPLTPRSLRFSRFQDKADTTKGSLNWNLMVSGNPESVPLPNLNDHATAGLFDCMPIPDGVPGVMILSYGKIIEELILPQALKALDLTGDKFKSDSESCKAVLSQDVPLKTSSMEHTKSGTFKAGGTVIYPELDKGRFRVDFAVSDIKFDQEWYTHMLIPGLALGSLLEIIRDEENPPTYKVKWSGYISLKFEQGQFRVASYTQDPPSLEYQHNNTAWRVITDISTVGVNELQEFAKKDAVEDDISQFVESLSPQNLSATLETVELPGKSVFKFKDESDFIDLGMRLPLCYEDRNYTQLSLEQEHVVRSVNRDEVILNIHNQSGQTLTSYWITFEGKVSLASSITNATTFSSSTWTGNYWSIHDKDDKCIAVYRLDSPGSDNEINITIG